MCDDICIGMCTDMRTDVGIDPLAHACVLSKLDGGMDTSSDVPFGSIW